MEPDSDCTKLYDEHSSQSVGHATVREVKELSEESRTGDDVDISRGKARNDLGAVGMIGNWNTEQPFKGSMKFRRNASDHAKISPRVEEKQAPRSECHYTENNDSEEIKKLREDIKRWKNKYSYLKNAVLVIKRESRRLCTEMVNLRCDLEHNHQFVKGGKYRQIKASHGNQKEDTVIDEFFKDQIKYEKRKL